MSTQAALRSKLNDGAASSEVQSQDKTNYSASLTNGTGVHGLDRDTATENKTQPCIVPDEEEDITEGWIDEVPFRFEPPPSYQDIDNEDGECPFSDEELDQPMSTLPHRALYWAFRRSDRIRDAARARPVPDPILLADFEDPRSRIRPSEHALGRRSRLYQSWIADSEDNVPILPKSDECKSGSIAPIAPTSSWADDENGDIGDPMVLLEYFASCKKGSDASCQKEAIYQNDSEDEDSLDSIEEDEELGDVNDLINYFESCKSK